MTAGSPIAGGAGSSAAEAAAARRAARLIRDAGQLRDGTPVRVRPLVAQDRALLVAGFSALSRRSRRARFLQGVSDAQFARMLPVLLDTVDQQSHVALVLYADGRPIGVGRLRRFTADPGVADLAVTVADVWQGRGGRLSAGSGSARPRRRSPGDADLFRVLAWAQPTTSAAIWPTPSRESTPTHGRTAHRGQLTLPSAVAVNALRGLAP